MMVRPPSVLRNSSPRGAAPLPPMGPLSFREMRGKSKEMSSRAHLSRREPEVCGGGADDQIRRRSAKEEEGEGGGRGQESIPLEESSLPAHAPHPSISLPRTGYLGNVCSLIITLQRVPLILPEESASCQAHRVLVNSINTAIHLHPHPPSSCPLTSNLPTPLQPGGS